MTGGQTGRAGGRRRIAVTCTLALVALTASGAASAPAWGSSLVPANEAVLASGDLAGGAAQSVPPAPWLAAMPKTLQAAIDGRAAQSRLTSAGMTGFVVASRAAVFASRRAATRWAKALERSRTTEVDALALGVPEDEAETAVSVDWHEGTVVGQLVYLDPTGEWGSSVPAQLVQVLRSRVHDFAPPTVWNELVTRVAAEERQPEVTTALQAFSLAVHHLPGVTLPSGPTGTPDATTALEWIREDHDQFTEAQRAEVEQGLQRFAQQLIASSSSLELGAKLAARNPAEGHANSARSSPSTCTPGVTFCVICFSLKLFAACKQSDVDTLKEAQKYYFEKLGLTGPPLPIIYFENFPSDAAQAATIPLSSELVTNLLNALGSCERCKTLALQEAAVALGKAIGAGLSGPIAHPAGCAIGLFNPGRNTAPQDRKYILAHEVFHCVTYQLLAGAPATLPGWLSEGTPTWAGCQFAPGAETPTGWSNQYITTPEQPLFTRTYDAIGFFSLLEDLGLEPWSLMSSILTGGQLSTGGNSQLAYESAVAGHEEAVLDGWSSQYFREPEERGPEWEAQSPCGPSGVAAVGPNVKVTPKPLPVANGSSTTITAEPFATGQYRLDSKADIVHISDETGSLRVNGGHIDETHVHDAYYCTEANECECPPEEHSEHEPRVLPPDPPTDIAATGAPTGLEATIEGEKNNCVPGPKKEEKEEEAGAGFHLLYSGSVRGSGPIPLNDSQNTEFSYSLSWSAEANYEYGQPRPHWHFTSLSGTQHEKQVPGDVPENCTTTISEKAGAEQSEQDTVEISEVSGTNNFALFAGFELVPVVEASSNSECGIVGGLQIYTIFFGAPIAVQEEARNFERLSLEFPEALGRSISSPLHVNAEWTDTDNGIGPDRLDYSSNVVVTPVGPPRF